MKLAFLQFIQGNRLRNKFAIFFVILATVPVLVLGGVALFFIDLSHKQDVSRLELQLIDQKIEEIEKFFADTLGILELRVSFEQKAEIELSSQLFILEGLLEENKAFEEVSFISLSGKETAKKIRYQESADLIDVSRLKKFQGGASGRNFIGDVYHTLSGPAVTLAAPVYNKKGEIIQLLSAEVNLAQIVRSIEASHLGTIGYLIVTDSTGSLIAHGGFGTNGKTAPDLSKIERVKRVLSGETLDALGNQDRYKSFLTEIPVVGAGKKLSNIGWAILAEWPILDADALIQDIRNQVAIVALFGIAAVLIVAQIFAGRLVRPIKQLEQGALEVEKGNFEKQIDIQTKDELEDLGAAFNKMAKGLKTLKELQEEFVFVAAHDLRAPVSVIKGYLSMVLGGEAGALTPQMKEYLGETEKANRRLLQLVHDLLEVARSEAGRISIKLEPVDIREPVRELVSELKLLADQKSITLLYEEAKGPLKVMGNIERIKEVTANLVSNAIKYTQEKGEVKIFHEIKDNEIITHVQDNGFGISKEAQKKIFEKFYRVQTQKTQNIEGTGLGLFIVKQLVEKMNGKIWFVSEEGRGSTFSFSLQAV